ncbi:MAG TPA: carboxypeptidase-like regulatory domain-containing protein [Gemmatimonadaceae bacterium]|nr:carboxypeptidase-like regulatory domain-containing protein [Gemmatimonadaceae bacterium]
MSRFLSILLLPLTAAAQETTSGTGAVAGTVFDSVARAPIAGAVVQMVPASNINARILSDTTDSRGAYRISSVAPGKYLLDFQHAALDTLALAPPARTIDVAAGQTTTANLGTPAPLTILVSMCGARAEDDSSSAILGQIRDARTRIPLDQGAVETRWHDLMISTAGVRLAPRNDVARIGPEGWYLHCNVPGGTEIGAVAWSGNDSTGLVGLVVPPRGIARHDFFVGGTATVRGGVTSQQSIPLAGVRVGLAGRERSAETDSAGAFTFLNIPAGSHTIEVRALGYAPEQRRVDLVHGADTAIAVRMTSVKRVLDTIRVVGQRVFDRDGSGFLRRKRSGQGYFMDESVIARDGAGDLYGLMRRAPALHIEQQGFRRYLMMRDRSGGYCVPAVFLDGQRLMGEQVADLDLMVRPGDLRGVEVYRGFNSPGEFSNALNECGTVVMWTRQKRP